MSGAVLLLSTDPTAGLFHVDHGLRLALHC